MSNRPTNPRSWSHYPALDGLRGVAVLAVLLYHGGVAWAPGGFLGVEVFFVLSGFLITSLLVTEWQRTSTIALGAFWARRARRLLPALFCLVAVIGIYYALAGASKAIPGLKGDGISTLIYYGNWHQIASGASYFAATGPVSPLEHTWSLAIEEQFYLVWPLVVLGVLWLATRRDRRIGRGRGPLGVLLVLSLAGAVASAIDTALLFDGGRNLDRVYYGTDTRAGSLLIGASLAIVLAILGTRARARKDPESDADVEPDSAHARHRLAVLAALPALAALPVAIVLLRGTTSWLYPYGLIGLDGLVAVVILAAVKFPSSAATRILATAPLRALGKISYGVYLWHFPLFLWLSASATGTSGSQLLALRLAVTLGVSIGSYFLIEQPIRQRRRPTWLIRTLTPVAAAGSLAAILLASAAGAAPVGVPAADTLPKPPPQLRGSDQPCTITLKDGPTYGVAPVPAGEETAFEYASLGAHKLTWSGSTQRAFQTCPPKRVLLVGDSLAFTLGVPWLGNEDAYGIQLTDAGILGCAFTTQGELDVAGVWEGQSVGCPNEVAEWAQEERMLHPQAVVVELGYRDQFDWRIDGKIVHLGQPAFDAYVEKQIDRLVEVLGAGATKILFLTIPHSDPPNLANGSPAPAASPARRALINSMLEAQARRHPHTVRVLDIDPTVSPGDHYDATVNGQLCRFDGVHFSVYCSELLEPQVLGEVRTLLG